MNHRKSSQSQERLKTKQSYSQSMRNNFSNHSLHKIFETSQILIDERTNAQKYRHFYSLLKFAHTQLQVSQAELEKKYTNSYRQWHNEKRDLEADIESLSFEKNELQMLCVELQKNVLTEERLELIKFQVSRDIEQKNEVIISDALMQTEKAKKQCGEMAEELSRLRVDSDQSRVRADVENGTNIILYESEKKNFTDSHKEIINHLASLLGSDAESLADLYRENSEMRTKCHLVVNDSQKTKQLYDTQMTELKNELINVIDKLSAANSNNEALATKCEVLEEQVQIYKASLNRSMGDLSATRQKAIDCEKTKLNTEKYCENVKQRARVELADVRLASQQQRVELERQRDELAFQVQGKYKSLPKKIVSRYFGIINESYIPHITDLTNQISLAFARFEEVEEIHGHREQENTERESELRRSAEDTAIESQQRFGEMFRQLERTQATLRDLTAQHKNTTLALCEAEESKNAILKRWQVLRDQNAGLQDEVVQLKHEISSRKTDVRRLETVIKEMTIENAHVPERDIEMNTLASSKPDSACEIDGVREAYAGLMERFKSQKAFMAEQIGSLKLRLVGNISELERLKQENCLLKNSVPLEDFLKIQGELREFQRRKEGYWYLLQQTNCIFPEVSEISSAAK